VLCGLTLGAVGCIATETGNPSAREIEVDETRIDGFVPPDAPMPTGPSEAFVTGGPGSIDPPAGRVVGWNLENDSPPANTPVEPDGSFELVLEAAPDDLLRIQARGAESLSAPIDGRVTVDERFVLEGRRNSCFETRPDGFDIIDRAAGTETSIQLVNGCDEPVVRTRARLRRGAAGLSLEDDGPLQLEPGSSTSVTVRAGSDAEEDIVLLEIESPEPELRAVSVLLRPW
jgi:hypothetical protein